jgi:hypothetical protein
MTPDEQAVVLAMLAQDFPGSAELRAQVPSALVIGECGCGCATIELTVKSAPRSVNAPVQDGMLISAEVQGTEAGVLLFVKDGYLSCVEVYSSGDQPAVLPRPEQLVVESISAS